MKEKKRNYLKEFRYVSSFMIFIAIFGIVFTFLSLGLAFGIEFLIDSESQASILGEIVLYGGTAYTYYVGYRIFLKKWNQKINTKLDTKKTKYSKTDFKHNRINFNSEIHMDSMATHSNFIKL